MPNVIHFFTDYLQLIKQTADLAYGPQEGKLETNFRVTNLLKASADVFAYAACSGEVFIQDASSGFATMVIKPKSSIGFNGSKIKYFVYKGLKMSSIADVAKKELIPTSIISPYSSDYINKLHKYGTELDDKFIVSKGFTRADLPKLLFYSTGLQFGATTHSNSINIEYFFNKKETGKDYTPFPIEQGQTIGVFDKDSIGFEIIYGDCDITLDDLRNKEKTVIADASPSGNLALIKNIYKREQILNYVDACAFYGNFAIPNINDTPIQIGLNKATQLKLSQFKTDVIDKFFTNNDLYIDIRNQHKNSFNLYGNNSKVKIAINAKQHTATAFKEVESFNSYQTFKWPILRIKDFSHNLGLTTLDKYLSINIKLTFESNSIYKDRAYINLVSNDLKLDETKKIISERKTTNAINNLNVVETTDTTPKYTIDLPTNFTSTVNNSAVPTLIGLSCYFKQPVFSDKEFPSNYFLDNYFSVPYVVKDGKFNWGFYELPNAKTIIKCSNEECFTLSSPTTYKKDYLTFKGFAKDTKGMYFYVIAKTQSITAIDAEKDFFEFLDENIKIKNAQFIQQKFKIGGTPHFACVYSSTSAKAAELMNMHQNVDYLQIVAITTQQQANLFAQVANIGLDKDAPLRFCLKHKELVSADTSINFNKYELCISGYNTTSEQIEQISTGIYFYKEENTNERIFISEEYCEGILKPRSREAEAVLKNLKTIQNNNKVLFGHQDTLAYGRQFKNERVFYANQIRSDIIEAIGGIQQLPYVFGWDLGQIERKVISPNQNGFPRNTVINGVYESFIVDASKWANGQSIINTFSWHCDNPIETINKNINSSSSDTDYNDVNYDSTNKLYDKNTINKMLPTNNNIPPYWILFQKWLDELVVFFKKIVDKEGNLIPIIFRPYHEVSNSKFFWWHLGTPSDYITLWCKTVDYLRSKGLHNLLFAFCINDANDYKNTNETNTKNTINNLLSNYYPGDDYVDIIAFDAYQRPAKDGNPPYKTDDFKNSIKWHLETIELYNASKNKVIALTEVGADNITAQDYNVITRETTDNETESKEWWTKVLLESIKDKKLAYLLVWRNPCILKNRFDNSEFYAPFVLKGWNKNTKQYEPEVNQTGGVNFGKITPPIENITLRSERSTEDFRKFINDIRIMLKK